MDVTGTIPLNTTLYLVQLQDISPSLPAIPVEITAIDPALIFPTKRTMVSEGSESTLLGAGATFISAGFDSSEYSFIQGTITADQDGTFAIQTSNDGGVNFDGEATRPYLTGDLFEFVVPTAGLMTRVLFTNTGGVAQTLFRLTWLGKF